MASNAGCCLTDRFPMTTCNEGSHCFVKLIGPDAVLVITRVPVMD
jgi:hypothetical protein